VETLEAKLSVSQKQLAASRKAGNKPVAASHGEWSRQAAANKRLREENAVLYDENEELKAMVEMLKAQVSGRLGLVSDPRSSPFMGPTLNL
jgi:cell division protein FtsB